MNDGGQALVLRGPVGRLAGRVEVPPSKSLTNRALIAAAAAEGGVICNPLDCEDTRLLAAALAEAGWSLAWEEEIRVGRRRRLDARASLHLGNSGTGARLILGLLAAVGVRATVDGTRRLRERPMGPLVDALRSLGARLEGAGTGDSLPLAIDGGHLEGGYLALAPGASSQFVSSLLLAAPLMRRGLDLTLIGEIPSRPYLELTAEILAASGATVSRDDTGRSWRVASGGLHPVALTVEGDWSAAPFMLAAAALAGGRVGVGPLRADSRQGDRVVTDVLASAGLAITFTGGEVVAEGPVTRPFTADLRDCPDLFPALAVVAALGPPGSTLAGLDHLRHKECDRLTVMVDNLRRLGARCTTDGTSFTVAERFVPPGPGTVPVVTAAGDHRVAMAMAVAALAAGPLALDDPRCVVKSFPGFWQQWEALVASATGRER